MPLPTPTRRHASAAALVAVLLLGAFTLFTFVLPSSGSHRVNQASLAAADRLVHNCLAMRDSTIWLMNNLAQLGGPLLSVLLLAALSIISAARGRWLAAGLLVGLFLAMAAVEASLRLRLTAVAWQNPTGLFAHPRGHYVIDSSYPSGHMARFLFLALITAQLLPARWRSIGVLLALAGGVFVAGQRVVSLAHTGSDVVGGWLLGAGAAVVYAAVAPRLHKLEQWGRRRERYFP